LYGGFGFGLIAYSKDKTKIYICAHMLKIIFSLPLAGSDQHLCPVNCGRIFDPGQKMSIF
jgi:ligand-binding sensor protein